VCSSDLLFGKIAYVKPHWLPTMEFPWWICFGTIVTFFVAILFQTDREHRAGYHKRTSASNLLA